MAVQFARESFLVEHLLGHLPAFLSGRSCGWRFAAELSVGRSIADVVAATWNDPIDSAVFPISVQESVVLASLRRGGATRVDLLERRCGMRSGELRDGRLERLQQSGLIERGPGGRIWCASTWPSSARVIAIEAKLTHWRTAIGQAASHARYADETYVALPHAQVRNLLGCEDVFLDAGVGLLEVGAGALRISISARCRDDHDWRREFVLSRVLNAQDAESPCHA